MKRVINHKNSVIFLLILLFGCGSESNTPRSNQNTSPAQRKSGKTVTATPNSATYNQKQNDNEKKVDQLQIVPQLSRENTTQTGSEEPVITDKKDRLNTIDQSKKTEIFSQLGITPSFYDGMAAIKVGKKWGFIDANGNMVIPPQFEEVNPFSEGSAEVKSNGQWVHIDKTGKIVSQRE